MWSRGFAYRCVRGFAMGWFIASEKVGRVLAAIEIRIVQNFQMQRDIGLDAVNDIFACVKEDAPDPAARTESIKTVLAKIALAAAGKASAVAAPAESIIRRVQPMAAAHAEMGLFILNSGRSTSRS